jgi:hypothetical protein
MLKKLLLASALTMAFSGAAMANDAPQPGPAGCTSCVLPTGNASAPVKLAQLGPVRGNPVLVGNAIPVPRDGPNVITMCCPPMLQGKSLGNFERLPPPGGPSAPYGVTFIRDTGLDAAMLAFAPFAAMYVPSGYVGNSIHLNAELRQLDPVDYPRTSLPTSLAFNDPQNINVKQHSVRAWWLPNYPTTPLSPTGVWDGPLTPHPPSQNWEHIFEDGYYNTPITPSNMLPNKWYMIKLKFQMAMKLVNRPDSWEVRDINCTNMKPKYLRIKWDYDPDVKLASGGGKQFVVEEVQ